MHRLFIAILSVLCADSIAYEKPNIIVILADDMGFSDLGCTGAEIETPNLDSLAQNGLLFTNFYNTSRCCPSRAALLTGQYQWDTGMGHMTYTNSKLPEYQKAMNDENATIAELLKTVGYQTVISGKWHLGDARDKWPDRRGFEYFYGTPLGGGIYFYPSKFYKRPVFEDGVEVKPGDQWYSTDGFTDYCIDFIAKKRDKTKPFFMYIPYIAPHFPLQAKEKDIEKYKGKYDVGYKKIRDARFRKQLALGLFDRKRISSDPVFPNWKDVKKPEQESLEMAVYAAQVDNMDQNIGRLVDTLREQSILDNTIVMFCQTMVRAKPGGIRHQMLAWVPETVTLVTAFGSTLAIPRIVNQRVVYTRVALSHRL